MPTSAEPARPPSRALPTLAVAALAALAAAAVPLTAGAQETAAVEGRVTDADGPVPGASVVVSGPPDGEERRVRADDDGRFAVRGLAPGGYRLRVRAPGWTPAERRIEGLEPGEVRRVEVTLRRSPFELRELEVVTATRSRELAGEVPAAVTVLSRDEVEAQTAMSTDLGDVLGRTVPGLSPSTESQTDFGQTLRGRDLQVMIDGVPITTPLRNGQRSLRTLDPSTVERVEVVRGATAAYGFGGTGGLINFRTRVPEGDGLAAETRVRASTSTNEADGSLDARVSQTVAGGSERVRFVASAAHESRGRRYDARGDMVPVDPQGQGGLSNAEGTGLFGKVAVSLSASEELSVLANRYELAQDDPEFVTVPGVPGERKARAEPGDPGSEAVGNENTLLQVRYRNTDLAGSELTARAYYLDNVSRFPFSAFFDAQSRIEAEKHGARLDVQTPLPLPVDGASVTWGADLLDDRTAQPLGDGRFFVPPMDQRSVGPFAQLEVPVTGRLTARGGVRHEEIWLDVDDFTTIEEVGGSSVRGGELQYDATVFNAGLTYRIVDGLQGFASFSQGFSVAEVGRELRTTSAPSVEALSPAPKTSDHWEIGVRGRWDRVRFSASGYLNESDLGSSFGPDLRIVRAPEEITGLEARVDVRPASRWKAGGSLSLISGEQDADGDGEVDEPLNSLRIPPAKITAYAENETLPGWRNRVHVLHSGSRDAFPSGDAFGQGAVDAYTLVHLTSGVDLWRGTLEVGVENLFDEFYFPVSAQATNTGFAYSAGTGRRVSVGYRIGW